MNRVGWHLLSFITIVLAVLFGGIDSPEAQIPEWSSLVPEGFIERVIVRAYGKEFVYYGFDKHTPLTFHVKGPTHVRVLTRLRFTPEMTGEQSYELTVFEKGVERKRGVHRTALSTKASYIEEGDLRLGKAMSLDFVIDDTSRHTFDVRVSADAERRIEARIYKLKEDTEIAPIECARTVTAFLSEGRERIYSVASRDHPVRIRVSGPTLLTVQTRLDYSPEMVGKQMYTLKVFEDDTDFKTFHVESVRSSTVTYKDRPEVIPGALNTIQIEIPAGLHMYEFRLPNSQFTGVALRFLVPTKDIR